MVKSHEVLFLSHGGDECGMGHITRCLSLAAELGNLGCHIGFISKYARGIETLRECGYAVHEIRMPRTHVIKGGLNDPRSDSVNFSTSESDVIIDRVKGLKPDIIIIDTYEVSHELVGRLCRHAFTVHIDDIYAFDSPADVILNGNVTGRLMGYRKYFSNQVHLLGMEYNLIRKEFHNLPPHVIKEHPRDVMITTGASDPEDMTSRLLDSLLADAGLACYRYHVVVGPSFVHKEKVIERTRVHDNVIPYVNHAKMSELMRHADIAISAGGGTLYELAACGTPSISFIYAQNQRKVSEFFSENPMTGTCSGYIRTLGFYDEIDYLAFLRMLKDLIGNYEYRKNVSIAMQQLMDGKGARRSAEKIMEYYEVSKGL